MKSDLTTGRRLIFAWLWLTLSWTSRIRLLRCWTFFYPGFADMPAEHYQQAIERCLWFINCGEEETERQHIKLMDWEQDFKYIVAPINRVTGTEIRSIEYMHWWTFIAAYYEIGDCTFAQIVRIRDKKARGKPLDKTEQEWYRKNRHLVDLKTKYTQEDDEILRLWGG